jgi:hypothetical protein
MGICIEMDHLQHRIENDLEVHPYRAFFYVDKIVVETLAHVIFIKGSAPESIRLCQSGSTRLYRIPVIEVIKGGVPVGALLYRIRTGSYEAHISLKYIDNLGQFIQVQLSQQLAEREYPEIPNSGNIWFIGMVVFLNHVHGSELVAGKRMAILPGTLLFE